MLCINQIMTIIIILFNVMTENTLEHGKIMGGSPATRVKYGGS